jgi:hypothetical protein
VLDMSKKIQVTFEDWQYEKVVSRAAKNEMNVSSYVRCCVLEYEYVCKSLEERYDQIQGLMELLISNGVVIPKELLG